MLNLHTLHDNIKLRRRSLGLTQEQLAQAACVTRSKIVAIERGDPSVGFGYYMKVADALQLTINATPASMPTLEELTRANHGR